MVRLKNRNLAPPSGFIVDVPETGFHQVAWGFDQAVSALQSHLGANPGIYTRFPALPKSREACEEYVDTRNANRCLSIKGGENFILKGGQFTPSPFPNQRPSAGYPPVAVGRGNTSSPGKPPSWLKTLGHSITGAHTLADWLPNAQPVAPELSEQRASICASCPKNSENVPNHKGNWLNLFTEYASRLVRRQLQERKKLNLSTSKDDQLGLCLICECPLPLKLHVPHGTIVNNLRQGDYEKLPDHCWIKTES